MHGQKKRRKRTMQGAAVIEGHDLQWELVSEPQLTSERRYIGVRLSVRAASSDARELLLQFPFPGKRMSG